MITLKGVFKKLDMFCMYDISLNIPKGYIMGLIGVNGSGKTTLLNIILGLYGIDRGCVTRRNAKGEEVKLKEFMDKCGYVLHGDWFEGMLTFAENANLFGKYYTDYNYDTFVGLMNRFNLDVNRKYKDGSKGEKLKFQFAFAMSHDPDLLILDEPTASFDPEFRQDFLKLITEYVADGEHTVILATHITEELDRIADYITFIDNGQIIFSLDKERLADEFRLVKGEEYKIKLIPKERVIYRERGEYCATALVRNSRYYRYDNDVTLSVPTLEDIMYYCIKGGAENVKIDN